MGDDKQSLSVDEVVQYLRQNPDFFIQQPDVLDSLELSQSPQGTISLSQRQLQRLQEKNRHLQEQLHALIDNAHSNSELQQRVHQLSLKLMDTSDFDELLTILTAELKQEFAADEVALRLFYQGDDVPDLPLPSLNVQFVHADDDSLRVFDTLFTKQSPICGRLTKAQKAVLFDKVSEQVESVATLPLGHEPCAGVLAIASHDPNRFHADMGTVYLSFLGEVFMRLLRRFCHHHEQ